MHVLLIYFYINWTSIHAAKRTTIFLRKVMCCVQQDRIAGEFYTESEKELHHTIIRRLLIEREIG